MKSNWVLAAPNKKLSDNISAGLSINPITAQVLINRGIKSEIEAEAFLNPKLFDLPSPNLMKDMDKAVERLDTALNGNHKIAIYGDYDVDGVTSTSLFYKFLTSLGMEVVTYNPDRIHEGYGINTGAVDKLHQNKTDLIISCDCGITAYDEVEYAKSLGIDFIITDHHLPPEKVPDAVAVLNPNQKDCNYPDKDIAGVGVIFNFAIAFRRHLRDNGHFKDNEPNLGDFLDLVALGTVADCAAVTNTNRIFIREGIKRMQKPKRAGIRALKEVSGIHSPLNSFDIGFKLGPRINAAGRLDDPGVAVRLLITEDIQKAKEIAEDLNNENIKRQNIEKDILKEAIAIVESSSEFKNMSAIVLGSANWHQGVIGIVASRICEMYGKPVFLIANDGDGTGKGSGRSVDGVDLHKILSSLEDILETFGGHQMAAGITIKEEKIELFREKFSDKVSRLNLKDTGKKIEIDIKVDFDDINFDLVDEIERLSPYGIGNNEPVFLIQSAIIKSQKVFKNKHLGITFTKDGKTYSGIWFNLKEIVELPEYVDIVFSPQINEWQGKKEIRFNIKDVYWQ